MMSEFLKNLPDVESIKKLSQSLAVLDAIISPDWEYRYYSFDSKWDENEMMASMRDGSGDEYIILFNSHGAIIKGFAHESSMSPHANEPIEVWKGVFDDVPEEFSEFLTEPAFSIENTTFCIWRKYTDSSWQIGEITYPEENDPDGLIDLLSILDFNPSLYNDWAEDYYEIDVPIEAVTDIYKQKTLTDELVCGLNKDNSLEALQKEIDEIGYQKKL